jgi:hypothetical protein
VEKEDIEFNVEKAPQYGGEKKHEKSDLFSNEISIFAKENELIFLEKNRNLF